MFVLRRKGWDGGIEQLGVGGVEVLGLRTWKGRCHVQSCILSIQMKADLSLRIAHPDKRDMVT